MPAGVSDSQGIEKAATAIAGILRAVANEKRLLILCKLGELGEATVNSLAGSIGLSQSALSQHLAKMRNEGLVTYRRESQALWYRIADPRIERLLATLHKLYCEPIKHRRKPKE